MSLIKFEHYYDFGHDWNVQLLNVGKHFPRPFKDRSLLQVSFSWSDCPCGLYFQLSSGNGRLFDVFLYLHRFGFEIDLLGNTWRRGRDELD